MPIRTADTISVKKRLPPGAAAVLINPTHSYTDLLLQIDENECRIFDAVDGSRSIGEIAARTRRSSGAESHAEKTRAFFERLWWHDQVVFDASGRSERVPDREADDRKPGS